MEKPMTKEEWDAKIKVEFGDTKDPKFAMDIKDRKTIDRLWPWLKTANVVIRCSKELKAYWVQKLKNERKYQS
jgi:hypothetical protein